MTKATTTLPTVTPPTTTPATTTPPTTRLSPSNSARGAAATSPQSASKSERPTSSQSEAKATARQTPPTAAELRAQQPEFVASWSIEALLPKLPLRFSVDVELPPSPKARYRSHYRYLGPELLRERDARSHLSDFQLALYLVDFSPLEPLLAQQYARSRTGTLKGQVPFHPVSMLLALQLRLEERYSWSKLARLLAGPDGSHWRRLHRCTHRRLPGEPDTLGLGPPTLRPNRR